MRFLLVSILIGSALSLSAQHERSSVQFKCAYLATIRYPGFFVGAEFIQRQENFLRPDSITLRKTRIKALTVNYAFYYHKNYHANHQLLFGYVWRRMNKRQWFIEAEPQLGISRTFVDGTTYRVTESGTVTRKRNAGDLFLSASAGFGVGRQLKWNQRTVSCFAKPSLMFFIPYNNFFYARPAIHVGFILTSRTRKN